MPLVKRAPAVVGNLALLLVISSVGLATLAFGAVHAPWMAAAAAVAHLGLVLHVVDRALKRRPLLTSWLCLPLVLGLALTLFELTPLPLFLRELLSPGGTERVLFAKDAGMGEGAHFYKIDGKYFIISAWYAGRMRLPAARADRPGAAAAG